MWLLILVDIRYLIMRAHVVPALIRDLTYFHRAFTNQLKLADISTAETSLVQDRK